MSVKHPNPQFEGQTKTKLGNSEVVKITNPPFSEAFSDFLMEKLPRLVWLPSVRVKSHVKNLVWKFPTFQGN
ncbi:hypothetical protein HH205_03570 [Streptococcus pneumoniae]|nr:hypothetical protein HH205_03570 [Streptococcus pneumoniae]